MFGITIYRCTRHHYADVLVYFQKSSIMHYLWTVSASNAQATIRTQHESLGNFRTTCDCCCTGPLIVCFVTRQRSCQFFSCSKPDCFHKSGQHGIEVSDTVHSYPLCACWLWMNAHYNYKILLMQLYRIIIMACSYLPSGFKKKLFMSSCKVQRIIKCMHTQCTSFIVLAWPKPTPRILYYSWV